MDHAEVIVLIAVGRGGKNPGERFDAHRQIVNDSPSHILGLHGFIGTLPGGNGIKFIVKKRNVWAYAREVLYQPAQSFGGFGQISPGVHGYRIEILTVAGIGVIGVDIDSRSTTTCIQGTLGVLPSWVRLSPVDYFGLGIGFVDHLDEGFQKPAILFGTGNRIPIVNVLL